MFHTTPPRPTPRVVYTMARSSLWGRNELPTAVSSMPPSCPAEVNHQLWLRHFCFADGCTLEHLLSGQQVGVSPIIHHWQSPYSFCVLLNFLIIWCISDCEVKKMSLKKFLFFSTVSSSKTGCWPKDTFAAAGSTDQRVKAGCEQGYHRPVGEWQQAKLRCVFTHSSKTLQLDSK